jgi:IS30 family transposase
MSGYTQLTQGQRYQMEALLKAGHNQIKFATILSIHKSTVSRELRRNQGLRGYRPKQAHVACKVCDPESFDSVGQETSPPFSQSPE